MWRNLFRHSPLCGGLVLCLAACSQNTPSSPQATALRTQVGKTLTPWPSPMRRPFFATIHAAGHRIAASGVFEYYTPFDFRLTAVTEVGNVLFDVRQDWAGIHVTRIMEGLPQIIVENLCRDVSLAMRVPAKLDALKPDNHGATLRLKSVEGFQFDYTLDPEGRMTKAAVEVGTFDTLTVRYTHYDSTGHPTQLSLDRPLRAYTIDLSFTDQIAATAGK